LFFLYLSKNVGERNQVKPVFFEIKECILEGVSAVSGGTRKLRQRSPLFDPQIVMDFDAADQTLRRGAGSQIR
jgi:hypothetical protein